MKAQAQVKEFMELVKGLTLPDKPVICKEDVSKLCYKLIDEELWELSEHMCIHGLESDIYQPERSVRIADDLADLLYVVLYTCNAYGIDIEPIFDEVHRSNMTKLGAPKRNDGKQMKGENYEPPNLEPLIKAQMET